MRNLKLRHFMEATSEVTREALQEGVEPLALILGLQNLIYQLETQARQAEQSEMEAQKEAEAESPEFKDESNDIEETGE